LKLAFIVVKTQKHKSSLREYET